jgi:hypothetical protein
MKHFTTLFIVAAVSLLATAEDYRANVTQITNAAQEFSMSKSSEGSTPMNVYSAMNVPFWGTSIPVKFDNFFVECVITPGDMENVPIGAKVTAISCGGEIIPGRDGEISANSLNLAAYIQDDIDPATDPYTTGGYNAAIASYAADDLFAEMVPCALSNEDGSTAQVIHSDFDMSKPFHYTGHIFKVGLDIYVPEAVYFCYYTTTAETEVATTYHTTDKSIFKDVVLYYNCPYLDIAQQYGVDMGMTFEPNKLPAFTLTYFTNDVKGKVNCAGGELTLSDGENTLTATADENGEFTFANVDYTKTYTLSLDGEVVAENLAFENITKDIYVEIGGTIPGDVNGDGNVTAADVTALYDWLLNSDDSSLVNGDQNNDGSITSGDVTTVYNIILGSK